MLYTPTHSIPNKSHLGEGLRAFSTRGNCHPLSRRNNKIVSRTIYFSSAVAGRAPLDRVPPTVVYMRVEVHMTLFALVSCSCHNKPNDLKQQKCILSQVWSPEIPNLFQWVKIKVLAGPCCLCRQNLLLDSSDCWRLPAFLGLWPHHCNLCLHFTLLSSLGV